MRSLGVLVLAGVVASFAVCTTASAKSAADGDDACNRKMIRTDAISSSATAPFAMGSTAADKGRWRRL